MQKINLKNIVDALKDVSVQNLKQYPEHYNIGGFSFGNVSKLNTIEIEGAHIHIMPTTSPIDKSISNITLTMYIMDLIDEDNELQVINDTMEIIVDILKKIGSGAFKSSYGFKLISETDITPFIGEFDSITAGWLCDLTFEVFNGSTCYTSFVKYYDITFSATKPGVSETYIMDSSYGDMRNMFDNVEGVYVSTNGGTETFVHNSDYSTTYPSDSVQLVLPTGVGASLNKLRFKN